jgi:hypothetical protein
MIPPKFAAGMNGALFIDLSFAFVMFCIYIGHELSTNGYRMRAQAAISIAMLLLGEMILRGWFWFWRLQVVAGRSVEWMSDVSVVPLGMSIEMVGVLCLIRVFSPDHWSRMTWLAVGAMSAVVACVAVFGI